MLKPKALLNVLEQTNTGGVENTLLLTLTGSLIASTKSNDRESKLTAALVYNIWSTYEQCTHNLFNDGRPQFILYDCEDGRLAITAVGDFLLCLKAQRFECFGMLKLKAKLMAAHLTASFRHLQL